MKSNSNFHLVSVTVSLLTFIVGISGCGIGGSSSSSTNTGNTPGGGADIHAVNHIVYMLQENRSFDNYFGKLNDYRQSRGLGADVDGIPATGFSNPSFDRSFNVNTFHLNTVCTENVSPGWGESHRQFNREDPAGSTGAMDGFVYSAANYSRNRGGFDVEGVRAMGYYDHSDLPYYYFLATQFATSDRFFSSVLTHTPPNRLYAFAATSGGYTTVPSATLSQKSIWEALQNNGISWKIYTDTHTFLSYFQPFGRTHMDHVFPKSQYFTDVKNGTLPAVAFIENNTGLDEHPSDNVQLGAKYASTFINALINSASWHDSVFFLAYDEAGGIYDHVPPPSAAQPDGIAPVDLQPGETVANFDRYGFRVPFIAISPFTKKGYVSHTVSDLTSILKFIETRWGLPNLTARDASQPDLTELFDFNGVPNAQPDTPPVQPIDGTCNRTLLQ